MRKKLLLFLMALVVSLPVSMAAVSTKAKADELIIGSAGNYDVVVYGATSGGVTAAIAAKKEGANVLLISQNEHIGGLTSSGLGATDIANKNVVGGLSREFYNRVYQYYKDPTSWVYETEKDYFDYVDGSDKTPIFGGKDESLEMMWVFEPKVASNIFKQMLIDYGVPIIFNEPLNLNDGVVMEDGNITKIISVSGKEFSASVFIDASYEGDLMAKANVNFRVGREANSEYGETMNGVLPNREEFAGVSPYIVAGDPNSGLLPFIEDKVPGQTGEADGRVQAYCFRLTLSTDPSNRMPITKPANYHPEWYETRARQFMANPNLPNELTQSRMPNLKTDTNHADFVGMSYEYANGDYLSRKSIEDDHRDYALGLMYFYAYDERVPAKIRREMLDFGLAKDEFTSNGNFPVQIYLREGRRMVSDYVMKESDVIQNSKPGIIEKTTAPYSVGQGFYWFDSHRVAYYVKSGGVGTDGNFWSTRRDYPISYQSITPKEAECINLFVPVCLSSTHAAYGSIRMETTYMIVSESAGTAAAMVAKSRESNALAKVQDIDYKKLAIKLSDNGQLLGDIVAPNLSPTDNMLLGLSIHKVIAADEEQILSEAFKNNAINTPSQVMTVKSVLFKSAKKINKNATEATALSVLQKNGIMANTSVWESLFSENPPSSMSVENVKSLLDKINIFFNKPAPSGYITDWVNYFFDNGIISESDRNYFDDNAVGGKTTETTRTRKLLIALAQTIDSSVSESGALQVFINAKITGNAAVWQPVFDGTAEKVTGTNLNSLLKNTYDYFIKTKVAEGKVGIYHAQTLVDVDIIDNEQKINLIQNAVKDKAVSGALAKSILLKGAQYLDFGVDENNVIQALTDRNIFVGTTFEWADVMSGNVQVDGMQMQIAVKNLAIAINQAPIILPITSEQMAYLNSLNIISYEDGNYWIENAVRGKFINGGKMKLFLSRISDRLEVIGLTPLEKLLAANILTQDEVTSLEIIYSGANDLNGAMASQVVAKVYNYVSTHNEKLTDAVFNMLVEKNVVDIENKDLFLLQTSLFADMPKADAKNYLEKLSAVFDNSGTDFSERMEVFVKLGFIVNKQDWIDKMNNDAITVISGNNILKLFKSAASFIDKTFAHYNYLLEQNMLSSEQSNYYIMNGNNNNIMPNQKIIDLLVIYAQFFDNSATSANAVDILVGKSVIGNRTAWDAAFNDPTGNTTLNGLINMTEKFVVEVKKVNASGLSTEVLDYYNTVVNTSANIKNGIFGNSAATYAEIQAWAKDIGNVPNYSNTKNVVLRAFRLVTNAQTPAGQAIAKAKEAGFTFGTDVDQANALESYWTPKMAETTPSTIDGEQLRLMLQRIYDYLNPMSI